MAEPSVRVEGLGPVARALRALGSDLEDLGGAFTKLSAQGAVIAAGLAPKKSGRLAGSVRAERTKNRAAVTATVPYAGPINGGWHARNIEPTRFMQKADQAMQPIAVQLLETDIDQAIRKRGLSR